MRNTAEYSSDAAKLLCLSHLAHTHMLKTLSHSKPWKAVLTPWSDGVAASAICAEDHAQTYIVEIHPVPRNFQSWGEKNIAEIE